MRITCTVEPLGKTPKTVCPLPNYTSVELVEVIKGPLTGDELLELFFTGEVVGKVRELKYTPVY
jgi:hypothetical protein